LSRSIEHHWKNHGTAIWDTGPGIPNISIDALCNRVERAVIAAQNIDTACLQLGPQRGLVIQAVKGRICFAPHTAAVLVRKEKKV
jgi:hypothetical protein